MNETNRYTLMLEALAELEPELKAARSASPRVLPALSEVLSRNSPMPREALFLGVAADGLPVLLNVLNPVPGPVLIAGDEGSGKTNFLQLIARGVDQMHTPEDIQYGIITPHPEDWKTIPLAMNCVDVIASYDKRASEILSSLAAWAHSNHGEKQSVLLLIDDLSLITRMDHDARQNLRWLLLRGPARRVWPIVTIRPRNTEPVQGWLELFRTRFFGPIQDANDHHYLTGSTNAPLDSLHKGSEFAMREGADWLKFWIPTVD